MELLWRSLDPAEPSMEHGQIVPWSRLSGTVMSLTGGAPLTLRYSVALTEHGHPGRAVLTVEGGRTLRLERTEAGSWMVDGLPAPRLDSGTDVDIRLTPSMNTVPIRRLGLPVGGAADLRAVWVDVPSLDYRSARQRDTRLSEGLYRFEDLDSDDRSGLTVDSSGWSRCTPARSSGWPEPG